MGAGGIVKVYRKAACAPVSDQVLVVTNAGTGLQQVSATDLFFTHASMVAAKALDNTTGIRTDNAGKIHVGVKTAAGVPRLLFKLDPGEALQYDAPPGAKLNFYDLWFNAESAGDGVVILYS